MASLGLHLLAVLLGVLFIFIGHIKVTPQFFPEYHNYMKNEFGKFNKEFPFHRLTGLRPYAKNYRLAVGIAEMTCGSLLILSGGFVQTLANIVLLIVGATGVFTLQKLHYPIEYVGAVAFVTFLLTLRLALVLTSKTAKVVKVAKKKVQ